MDAAQTLFQNEKYDWCLFLAYLVLEKHLKLFMFKILVKWLHVFTIWLEWQIWQKLSLEKKHLSF
ncbi:MAG: HEPN domain-containing protein [Desulfobacula sp.]|nr:HEPN domain-containing protein [Desulfobacula sp.]